MTNNLTELYSKGDYKEFLQQEIDYNIEQIWRLELVNEMNKDTLDKAQDEQKKKSIKDNMQANRDQREMIFENIYKLKEKLDG